MLVKRFRELSTLLKIFSMIACNEITRIKNIMSSFKRERPRGRIVRARGGNGIRPQAIFDKIRFPIRVEVNP